MNIEELSRNLIAISKEAGKSIIKIYNSDDFGIEIKSDTSPLTKADRAANEVIEKRLTEIYPEIPILSEEGKETPFEERKTWTKFWLVDPLDGTKEFIKRNGEFTVNIALIDAGKPIAGVIFAPVTNEVYYGDVANGSFKIDSNGFKKRIEVSDKSRLDALDVVQSRSHSGDEEKLFYSNYKINESLSKGSSLKICLIAEGKAEIYFRGGPTWEWDTAAGHAILLGAGGYFVNKDKSELIYNKEIIKNFGFIVSSFKV
ncbi:MAG: 3'(2'),5'-bisphosphate nucleotidase CysQ [Melioribacteraceae bacterium]|jgi:3'(2'), 5'-bisphosphate nucleotidase|nr:3'(2'),5'-bisphosphate nucleotidase CysQ [Melioribacteraceae bacterium]